jgi:hypothetical protein
MAGEKLRIVARMRKYLGLVREKLQTYAWAVSF